MYLISACLCGVNCKYNGGNNLNEEVLEIFKKGEGILVCPEQLGGLPTPRQPSEIRVINNEVHVFTKDNIDVTENFVKGANEVLEIAKKLNIKKAILKLKSPSCGLGKVYDGTFTGTITEGNGICASLLIENNIEVIGK